MTEAELRPIVARNIAACRKQAGMTQAELAEKLNYSDKTISKWERAEGLPDLVVSQNIAELFGVPLDALLRDDTPKPVDDAQSARQLNARRRMILLMSVSLCWLVATIAYFALKLAVPTLLRVWLAFIYAMPGQLYRVHGAHLHLVEKALAAAVDQRHYLDAGRGCAYQHPPAGHLPDLCGGCRGAGAVFDVLPFFAHQVRSQP